MTPTAARTLALASALSAAVAGCGVAPSEARPADAAAGPRPAAAPSGPKRTADAGDVQFAAVPAGVESVQVKFVTGRGGAAGSARQANDSWFSCLSVLPAGTGQTEAVRAGCGVIGRTYPPGDVTVKLWPSGMGEWLENAVPVVATPGRPLALDLADFEPASLDAR